MTGRLLSDVAKTAACLLLWVMLLEAGMHVAPVKLEVDMRGAHPLVGWTSLPNGESWCVVENLNYVHFNSAGYRDRDRTPFPARPVTRIAVLGDSFTEALQVPLSQRYTELLQHGLGSDYEVMNFGVDSYSLGQEFVTLKDILPAYHPQIVIVLVTFVNGIYQSSREMGEKMPENPFFHFGKDGRLVADPVLHRSAREVAAINRRKLLGNRVDFYRLMQAAMINTRLRLKSDPVTARSLDYIRTPNPLYPDARMKTWPYLPEINPSTARAWDLSEAILDEMNRTARAQGVRLLVVSADLPMQAEPDLARKEAFRRSLHLSTLLLPNRRLSAYAAAHGIDYLDLTPAMEAYVARTGCTVHGFDPKINAGHWNPLGHQVAGQAIEGWLRAHYKKPV